MRKFLLFSIIFLGSLFVSSASAQEAYTIAATAPQVARIERGRVQTNRNTCQRFALGATCTQAEACLAAGAAGGAGCTPAQARAVNAEIYAASLAGRQTFLIFTLIVPRLTDLAAANKNQDLSDYCVWYVAQSQTTKDAECVKIGTSASCDLCQ